ncbi:MAG: hypothetical protein CFE33_02810 [Pseudorhodobacter sp. PARRP1]|nr:MAG: hypothetical protein CFE33_02810 [Pseudorhodobacter sp. PARRP1]
MLQTPTINLIQSKIDRLAPGEKFTLPSLLGPDWDSIKSGDIGKEFKELVRDGNLIKGVRFLDAKDKHANYAKKG